MNRTNRYNPAPYALDLKKFPQVITSELPGPKSRALHARCTRHFKGLSEQVKLFPVAFESGKGCTLTDADGNQYIDFSSGIYVTTLGHCHPKVSEAVAKYANTLMNAHDFHIGDQDPSVREARRDPARGSERVPVLRLRHGGGRGWTPYLPSRDPEA
jgi:hypothetical protein